MCRVGKWFRRFARKYTKHNITLGFLNLEFAIWCGNTTLIDAPTNQTAHFQQQLSSTSMSEQAVEAFASVEQTLAAVEEHLQVFQQSSLESLAAELSPLEKAKVQVSLGAFANAFCSHDLTAMHTERTRLTRCVYTCACVRIAYSVNALLYVFLKTQGVSAKDIRQTHVKQELERVKAFIKKIKDTEELAKGPKLSLDKDASKRMVHSALSSDQVYVDALAAKNSSNESTTAAKDSAKSSSDSQKQSKNKPNARAPAGGKGSDVKSSKRRRKQ